MPLIVPVNLYIFTVIVHVFVHAHLYEAGVGDQLLGIHHVHQRLFDGHIANAAHVKSVHVLPPCGHADVNI